VDNRNKAHTPNRRLAKVAVQCSADPEVSGWLIKVWFSASIPIAIGMVKIATFAKRQNVMRYYKIRMRTFLLLSILLTSCGLTKRTESNRSNIQYDDNAIVFVVLRISKDSVQGKNVIEFVSKTKTVGKIKNEYQSQVDSENFLTIDLYEQDKIIKTIVIAHPLYKRVEYLDGNALSSKSIELNKEEFFIRLQIKDNSNKIRISETLKNAAAKELTTIKL